MDHHVPAPVVTGLRARHIDCLTTEEDGARRMNDASLLGRATELGRALFSQDVDLLEISAEWHEQGKEFAGLVYGHQLRITIGQAIRDLELIAEVLDPDEMRNRVVYLPL
jgi:hypothetical protein